MPRRPLADFVHILRISAPFYLIVPALLTGAMAEFGPPASSRSIGFLFALHTINALCIGIAHTCMYAFVLRPMGLHHWTGLRRWAGHLAAIVVGVVAGGELALLLHAIGPAKIEASLLRGPLYRVATTTSSLTVGIVMHLERMLRRQSDLQRRAEDARRHAEDAEIRLLQARTAPHFLFNSLNALTSLIPVDPSGAEEMALRLAACYRGAIRGSQRNFVALAEELQGLRDYLAVERMRFGARMVFDLRVDPRVQVEGIRVPPFTLQPLVENAIVHGIGRATGGGSIEVTVDLVDNAVSLLVENRIFGPLSDKAPPQGTQTALADLAQRLAILYGGSASLTLRDETPQRFTVEIRIPETPPRDWLERAAASFDPKPRDRALHVTPASTTTPGDV